jgi:3,4-dihydroxy 2-butanone 4-phosphate synthase/GTP cyclohydrolase II
MTLEIATQRFAAGAPVLVGDERDATIFVALAAEAVAPAELEALQTLGRGMVVLGLPDRVASRLELAAAQPDPRARLPLRLSMPIDAAAGTSGGWSLRDRALTMRVAADPDTGPGDLAVPGHVHAARIGEDGSDAATAALELAHLAGRAPAVALCAVVDRDGAAVSLSAARRERDLARLPLALSGELHGRAIGRRAAALSVDCELPTRAGNFRAVGYEPAGGDPATVALVHGDPARAGRPLVHVHVACLLGDAFGSLLCDCRAQLDAAVDAICAEGSGVIVYGKPAHPGALLRCAREEPIDSVLAAGLLRACGVGPLRLSGGTRALAEELRACGLEIDGEVLSAPSPLAA